MIIVDIETTGTDPRVHSIASIGAVDLNDPTREFSMECRIFEGAKIEPEALAINGYTKERLEDVSKPSDKECVEAFLKWALLSNDHTVAGQNPQFDLEFIKETTLRYHLNYPLTKRLVDLHSVTWLHMLNRGLTIPLHSNRSDLNSDKIMEYVGIPAEVHPHLAINGAKIEAEAFTRLFFDKILYDDYKNFPIPWL